MKVAGEYGIALRRNHNRAAPTLTVQIGRYALFTVLAFLWTHLNDASSYRKTSDFRQEYTAQR